MSGRVTASPEALYGKPRKSRKRRRCDGHLAERHWIEVGDLAVASALPPDSDIGNTRWWHHHYCMACAPEECLPRPVVRPDCPDCRVVAEVFPVGSEVAIYAEVEPCPVHLAEFPVSKRGAGPQEDQP